MEQNTSTDKNFLRKYSCHERWPLVCACPRLRSTRCRQTIVESSSLYFWSMWEQHVFFFIIVHTQMKIYEVLKLASMHLAVVIHYSTGTTSNSASLVLKRVRIGCFVQEDVAVKSSVEDGYTSGCTRLLFDWNYLLVEEGMRIRCWCKVFSGRLHYLASGHSLSGGLCPKNKEERKECTCHFKKGRIFFTGGGVSPWYSNRSPSIKINYRSNSH